MSDPEWPWLALAGQVDNRGHWPPRPHVRVQDSTCNRWYLRYCGVSLVRRALAVLPLYDQYHTVYGKYQVALSGRYGACSKATIAVAGPSLSVPCLQGEHICTDRNVVYRTRGQSMTRLLALYHRPCYLQGLQTDSGTNRHYCHAASPGLACRSYRIYLPPIQYIPYVPYTPADHTTFPTLNSVWRSWLSFVRYIPNPPYEYYCTASTPSSEYDEYLGTWRSSK